MSESKLKALKVVDLKDILQRAQVAVHGKANKSDLIAKILASPDALDVYHQLHASQSQKSAPPKLPPVPAAQPAGESLPSAPPAPAPLPLPTPAAPTEVSVPQPPESPPDADAPPSSAPADGTQTPQDEELARRKARAERFNIPLVETPNPKPPKSQPAKAAVPQANVLDDPEKLAARAKRFGLSTAATDPAPAPAKTEKSAKTDKPQKSDKPANGNGRANKRPAPTDEPLDPEEQDRRRKRAERFGLPVQNAVKV